MQVGLVVDERLPVGERYGLAAGLGEDKLSGRGVPFVGVGRANVIVDRTLGQQAELVGAALFDDLQIGVCLAYAVYLLEGLGCLVRA